MPINHPMFQARRTWTQRDMPDALWPSDNEYGIPSIRLDLQADALDVPVVGWGTIRRSSPMPGTWHFYVDDYRFNALWKDGSPILNSGCVNVIEPNFSVVDQTPKALALYHTYRKRWLARLWQEWGKVRIFVDLNVGMAHAQTNLLGVPPGWRAYASRGYIDRIPETMALYDMAVAHAGTHDILFVLYGGGDQCRQLAFNNGWYWIAEQRDVAKQKSADEARTVAL